MQASLHKLSAVNIGASPIARAALAGIMSTTQLVELRMGQDSMGDDGACAVAVAMCTMHICFTTLNRQPQMGLVPCL